jgi:hypothetical protein
LREEEESFTPSTINKEVLEEDMKQTAAMKNEIMEERRRLEEEVNLSAYNRLSQYVLVKKSSQNNWKSCL